MAWTSVIADGRAEREPREHRLAEPWQVAGYRLLAAGHGPSSLAKALGRLDIAFPGGRDSFEYLTKVPALRAWQDGLQHIGTYGAPGGGSLGRIAVAWFSWQLKGDARAGQMFRGANCGLCTDRTWHVSKKKID